MSRKIGLRPDCITGLTVVGHVRDGTIISALLFHLNNSLAALTIKRLAELPEFTKIEYFDLFHFENCFSNFITSFPCVNFFVFSMYFVNFTKSLLASAFS